MGPLLGARGANALLYGELEVPLLGNGVGDAL